MLKLGSSGQIRMVPKHDQETEYRHRSQGTQVRLRQIENPQQLNPFCVKLNSWRKRLS